MRLIWVLARERLKGEGGKEDGGEETGGGGLRGEGVKLLREEAVVR